MNFTDIYTVSFERVGRPGVFDQIGHFDRELVDETGSSTDWGSLLADAFSQGRVSWNRRRPNPPLDGSRRYLVRSNANVTSLVEVTGVEKSVVTFSGREI